MVFKDLSTTLTYCDLKISTGSGYVENLSIYVVDNKIFVEKYPQVINIDLKK